MPINKVVYAGAVLLDLTGDTINEDVIIDGYTGHDKAGNVVTGKLKIITVDEALDANSTNPVENKAIVAALNNKLSTTGTAARATADANGNAITATYETKGNAITGLSISGKTITYTKGNGNTGTITTQDTTYTLPAATASALGGVKVGTNISVSSGTISVADGSTSAKGVVQLSSAVNSTSTSLAATASAVKSAYDLANGKQSPATTLAGYGITNAYTKTEVDTLIEQKVVAADHLRRVIVDDINSIGLGIAGQVDRENGILISAPNLDCKDLNFKHIFVLQKAYLGLLHAYYNIEMLKFCLRLRIF